MSGRAMILSCLLSQGLIPGLVGVSHGVVQFVMYDEMKKHYCNYHNIPISSKLVSKGVMYDYINLLA